jgi:hypothetical protein
MSVLGLAALAPGSSPLISFAAPAAFAVGYLTLLSMRRKLPDLRLRRTIKRMPTASLAPTIVAITLTSYAGVQLARNAVRPVHGYDALQYMGEAAAFAKVRTIASIPGISGLADGTVRGDLHSFAWPAYMAHALMAPPDALSEPFRNAGARVAIQLTMLYLLAAMGAMIGSLRLPGVFPVAIPFLLQLPQLDYVTQEGARDAFRTIPVLLLAGLLAGGLRRHASSKVLPFAWLSSLAIVSGFCVGGHTLGLILWASLVGLWAVFDSFRFKQLKRSLAVTGATTLGALAFSTHYISSFLRTGSLLGDNVVKHVAIAGTPLWDVSLQRDLMRMEHASGLWGRLESILARDHFRLSALAVVAAVAIMGSTRLRNGPSGRPLSFLAAYLLALLLPVLGVFDFGTSALTGTSLSQWFQMNFRYFLHWYPIAAAVVAAVVQLVWHETKRFAFPGRFFVKVSVAAGFALIAVAGFTETGRWDDLGDASDIRVRKAVEALTAATSGGGTLILEDLRYNYYLGNRAVVMYSRPTVPLIQARSAEQARVELRRLGAGAVAVQTRQIVGWWDQIPLWHVLSDPQFARVDYSDDNLTIFRILSPVEPVDSAPGPTP